MKSSRLAILLAGLSVPATASVQVTPLDYQPASVAVRFDRSSITPVLAEGFADRPAERLVTADDPVRIASISKLVTALGVMRLVDQGKLDLDRDVSDYLGYPLRHPAYRDKVITLRLLLSHQSGLIDADELYLIPLRVTLRERLADRRVWDTAHAPGSGWFHYTNLNFPVIGSVIERVTGERFDVAMGRLVLKPLKLDACFNWGAGCSAGAFKRAVVLYRSSGAVARDDLKGQPPACGVFIAVGSDCNLRGYRLGDNGALFSPQGGLRISMRDLAKVGQLLARGGKGFLSARSFSEMTRPQWRFDGSNGVGEDGTASGFFCSYGFAVHQLGGKQPGCKDDPFGDGRLRLGHAGDAYGLKAGLWLDPKTGQGIAFFTSAVAPDAPTGRSAFTSAEETIVERAGRAPFRNGP